MTNNSINAKGYMEASKILIIFLRPLKVSR
jgi:hypothetical protein